MNVTPLVDVVLVLLIIFMVVIPMMEKSVSVDLPSIFNVDPEPKGKTDPFTLSLTPDGSMYFEQEKLEPETFKTTLSEAMVREQGRRLVLRADQGTEYGKVRKLFKICQEIGFPGISLRVNDLKGSQKKD
jgi:biopolymer transport protein ExbD/biopolymer transport protein TolR